MLNENPSLDLHLIGGERGHASPDPPPTCQYTVPTKPRPHEVVRTNLVCQLNPSQDYIVTEKEAFSISPTTTLEGGLLCNHYGFHTLLQ